MQPLWAQTAALGLANVRAAGLAQSAVAGVLLPTGGTAVMGQANFDTSKPGTLWVTTQNAAGTRQSVINWQSFSIGAGGTTYFQQPDAASTSINRVVSNTPTLILGTLGSNGKLVLVNQSGIAVGAGAVVDTAGFTASTLQLSDTDAAAGRMRFAETAANPAGISVQGQIVARQGDVVLVAPTISTGASALIQAPNGNTILAAGRQVEISGRGLEGIALLAQAPTDQVLNLGTLQGSAVGIFAGTLTHSGLIQATRVTQEGGRVLLKASGDAIVNAGAQILATGDVGGSVQVLGQRVALLDQARVDASGTNGGGTVLIGGDAHGGNPGVQNASMSYVGSEVRIAADAIERGAGGKVVVWADEATRMHGRISASGGATGGAGGFVETSGKQFLDVQGARVVASAAHGAAGTWLLDPSDVTIIHATSSTSDAYISPSNPFTPTGGDDDSSKISDFTLNQALNNATDVTLATSGGGGGSGGGSGNISFAPNAAIKLTTGAGNTSLTLKADNDIQLQGSITNSSPTNSLALNLNAGGKVSVANGDSVIFDGAAQALTVTVVSAKAWNNSGSVTLNGNSTISLYDGNSVASFNNLAGATLTDNSSAAMSITSDAARGGTLSNSGTINAQGGGAWGVKYSQAAVGTLNVQGGLTLQNLDVVQGTVNIAANQTLLISENHGGADKFQGTTISGPGTLQIGQAASSATPMVTLSGVSTRGDLNVLVAGPGTVTFGVGNTFADSRFFNQSSASPNWTVPAAAYSGDVQWWSTGSLNLASNLQSTGNITLGAGWNGDLTAPLSLPTVGTLNLNKTVKSTAGNVSLQAGDRIDVSNNITASGTVDLLANNVSLTAGVISSASASASAIVLNAGTGNFTNSAGTGALTAPNGRWLVYSTDPASDNRGGLGYDFKQYSTSYGGSILGAGNGFIYSLSPTLNAVLSGAASKTYDGSTNVTNLAGLSVTASGAVDGDVATYGYTLTAASYDNKNAGSGKTVTASGITSADSVLSSTGRQVYGYTINPVVASISADVGAITPAPLSLSGTRSYDGTASVAFNQLGIVPGSVFAGDGVSLASGSASVASKNVGSYASLSNNTLALGGTDAANYSLVGAAVSVAITQASLSVSTGNLSKTYDGTTSVAAGTPVVTAGTLFAGDSLTGGSFAFLDKNVGTTKTIAVSGVSVSDGNGGHNYVVNQVNNSGSSITPASVSAVTGITAANKTADGTTSATLDASGAAFTGKFAGDVLNVAAALGAFADPHAGTGKSVAISGIVMGGADAGNYTLLINSATTSANIVASPAVNGLLVASAVAAFPDAFAQWLVQQGRPLNKDYFVKPVEGQLCLP